MKKLIINLATILPFILSALLLVVKILYFPDMVYENTVVEHGFIFSVLAAVLGVFGISMILLRVLIFSHKKLPFNLCESINLGISVVTLILPFIGRNMDLLYGGVSFILASTLSIFIIRILSLNFQNFEINILQFHIFICIFLGTLLNFYLIVPQFDFLLHLNFGVVSSVLCLPFIRHFMYKSSDNAPSSMLPFIILIIFCFSTTLGSMWEIYEFTVDNTLNLNTQNNSLTDTMFDIIANTIGAIGFCTIYFLKSKKQAK